MTQANLPSCYLVYRYFQSSTINQIYKLGLPQPMSLMFLLLFWETSLSGSGKWMNEIWLLLRMISHLYKWRIHTYFNKKGTHESTHLCSDESASERMSTRNSLDYFLLIKKLLTLFNQIKYFEYLLKKGDQHTKNNLLHLHTVWADTELGYNIVLNFLSPSLCSAVKTELPKGQKMQLTLLGPTLYPYVRIKEIDKNSNWKMV